MPVEVEKADGVYDYDALIGSARDTEPDIEVAWHDTALLQYTGGTTGVSKGCRLSNYNLVSIAYQDVGWFAPLFKPGELRTLAAIPVYHIFGFNCNVNVNLANGGTIILVPQPTPDNILDAINKHEPNFFAAVPTMIIGLNQHPETPKSKIRSIRGMISGSSPLAVEAMKTFEDLSGATIIEGYGLSETSNVLTCNPLFTKRKPGSVGLPWPDNDIRIVDLDTGTKELPLGEAGELIAKGPTVMSEYWRNESETSIAMRDGWLYTGDIAYMDEDGYIFIRPQEGHDPLQRIQRVPARYRRDHVYAPKSASGMRGRGAGRKARRIGEGIHRDETRRKPDGGRGDRPLQGASLRIQGAALRRVHRRPAADGHRQARPQGAPAARNGEA